MHDGLNSDEGAERTIIDLPLEVKADGAPGSFEGYGAVFGNTDRDGDVVEKGAFGESLKVRMPALLWQHNAKEPIGRFDVVKEDKKGLFVKGRLSMSGKGKEAYDLLKLGALNGLSIGFVTKEALRNRATGTRTIKRAELMEVSLVTFPANELARVQTVKGNAMIHATDDIETPRDFERMLRGTGFSRSRAKAITAKGFRAPISDDIASLVKLLEMKNTILKSVSKRSLETKGFHKLQVTAHAGGFKNDWKRFKSFTADGPTSFKLSYKAHAPRSGPFELQVRYRSRSGLKTETVMSHGMRNKPFLIPAGIHEVSVQAASRATFAQHLLLTLFW